MCQSIVYLDYCTAMAQTMPREGRVRVYAVAVSKRGKILAESPNLYCKSHPMQAAFAQKAGFDKKIMLHAEIACLVRLAKVKQKAYALYIARVDAGGNTRPAKPCPICSLAIEQSGIKYIYTT